MPNIVKGLGVFLQSVFKLRSVLVYTLKLVLNLVRRLQVFVLFDYLDK